MEKSDYEQYISWYQQEHSFTKNFFKALKPIHWVLIFLLLVVGYYLFQQESVNKNLIVVGLGVILFIIIFFSLRKKEGEKEPIPEHIIKIIGQIRLEQKVGGKNAELPEGTQISSSLYCRMRFEGDWINKFTPWKWEVGYKIISPAGLESWIAVIFNPWKGYITGIEPRPYGYDSREAHDIKIVPINVVPASKPTQA